NAVTFSPDGRALACASSDGTIRTWDLVRAVNLACRKRHPDYVFTHAFSTDGRRLATLSTNGTTWLWDGTKGSLVSCLTSHSGIARGGGREKNCFNVDERSVIAFGHDMGVWEAKTGKPIAIKEELPGYYSGTDIIWPPKENCCALVIKWGGLRLLDLTHLHSKV